MRESLELFRALGSMKVTHLFVSADRMERGTRDCTTLDELREDFGIQVCPIVTIREIITFLHNNPIDGKIYIDDVIRGRMEAYLDEYGGK